MVVPQRALGRTGMRVSALALGTVKLGRTAQVKYPTAFELPSDREARDLLDRARKLGINLLDTAPAYGTAEIRLGQLIAQDRDAWQICTKVGEVFEDGNSRYDFSEAHTRASVERSLSRLGGDALDIVLIHSDGRDVEILEQLGTLEVLQTLKRDGLVRAVGISVKSAEGLEAATRQGADVVMATLNATYRDEATAISQAGSKGVGILVKKALASGYGSASDLTSVANHPGVSSIVVGTINPEHLAANCAAVGV